MNGWQFASFYILLLILVILAWRAYCEVRAIRVLLEDDEPVALVEPEALEESDAA